MKVKLDVEFVLFDMIGTTVQDSNDGNSVIVDSFKNAFLKQSIDVSNDIINEQRGKSKQVAIKSILTQLNENMNYQSLIYQNFMNELDENVSHFQEIENASMVFQALKTNGIKIGIGSGLPLAFMMSLFEHLSWELDDFDYVNSSDELKKGRPDPVMILDAIDKLSVMDKKRVLKIGDTVVDVLEGKNANVMTAMVLSGTQTKDMLGEIRPDFIWQGIGELLEVL